MLSMPVKNTNIYKFVHLVDNPFKNRFLTHYQFSLPLVDKQDLTTNWIEVQFYQTSG